MLAGCAAMQSGSSNTYSRFAAPPRLENPTIAPALPSVPHPYYVTHRIHIPAAHRRQYAGAPRGFHVTSPPRCALSRYSRRSPRRCTDCVLRDIRCIRGVAGRRASSGSRPLLGIWIAAGGAVAERFAPAAVGTAVERVLAARADLDHRVAVAVGVVLVVAEPTVQLGGLGLDVDLDVCGATGDECTSQQPSLHGYLRGEARAADRAAATNAVQHVYDTGHVRRRHTKYTGTPAAMIAEPIAAFVGSA